MINTVNTKKEQLEKGFFTEGSGREVILIMGSCRAVPYMNYFKLWNDENGNRFTIHFIDPFNFNWDKNDDRVDYEAVLSIQERNELLTDMFKSVNIFIHEFYQNAGMFACNKSLDKNIYQFGLNPQIDLVLPNYNDTFVLTKDIVTFDIDVKKMALQDYNVIGRLSDGTLKKIEEIREINLQRFYEICKKSSFPEFEDFFRRNYKSDRLFWTYNHVSSGFTFHLFLRIAERINIDIPVMKMLEIPDLFANNYTHLCEYDEGYSWHEEIKPLKESL